VIHKQGIRWIAYIGHHGVTQLNPLTGKPESNGTSIIDVTDPAEVSDAHSGRVGTG